MPKARGSYLPRYVMRDSKALDISRCGILPVQLTEPASKKRAKREAGT